MSTQSHRHELPMCLVNNRSRVPAFIFFSATWRHYTIGNSWKILVLTTVLVEGAHSRDGPKYYEHIT